MESSMIQSGVFVKIKSLFELTKFKLSLLVSFSGAFGYCLGVEQLDWFKLILFIIAAYCITGSSNIINQIIERDLDKLMNRTVNRPLPTGRVSVQEASLFGWALAVIACVILFFEFNYRAGLLSVLSLVLYGFVYTPLKRVGVIAVIVGAFPGAFPPMIGWIAATNHFSLEPGILFAIQFFWQFPHFWAIAWVADEDYTRAGFRLLPGNGKKDLNTAIQMMIYTIFLLPIAWLPYYLGMTGINSAVVAMICSVLFLAQTFHLMREVNDKAARQLMFGSFAFLPIVQIAFLLDKL